MNYKSIIESRYNRQNWQLLLHDIFGNKIKFWNTPSVIPTSSQFAKQALWLGTITLSDNQTVSVYEVELSDSVDMERNRRGIRDMLLTDWRNNGNAGAFMFCYRKNESVLRFSYVSEAWTFADDGSYQKESTDAKRFTYLLGEGHRSRTAIQQFEKLRDSSLTLKDLTKAFSVDAVSDMFFKGYKQQYEDIIFFVTGKRMVKVANKWEERQEGKPNDFIMQQFAHTVGGDLQSPSVEKAVRDYVKKLMGRLVFLQFLQKKGWLGVPAGEPWGTGDREFIQTLFANCQDKDHFIDNVLEVLFEQLNTDTGERGNVAPSGAEWGAVPYLNGGLFERDATDEAEFPLPAKYMQSLLDFFASYNFTIDENDPDDAEVGVDPEMLGRIFENLLEDNKDKGAFYTPKEIVSYMCRESLIAYLQTDIEDEATKEAIRQFVTTHDVSSLGTNDKFRQQVDEALKNVKICDPAIGSGAFPMGLLKELFQCRTALEGIDQSKAAEIKKHIIQQNIYGVDIERGAVDIARLRFWLSLIVDEETPQALPNLDFKIMQGNSLLEQYKGVDLSNITELKQDKVGAYQTTMFDDMLDVLRLDLRKKLDDYYNCTDHNRKAILKQDIINNVKQQLKEQSINVEFGDLDLSGNNQFMLWHTWFYDVFSKGGFDIVIGNPPYLSALEAKKVIHANIRDAYKRVFDSAKGTYDLYVIFIELGLKLLAKSGNLMFITPSKYLSAEYANALRTLILENYSLEKISDFSEIRVFESAGVSTMISHISNKAQSKQVEFTSFESITQIKSRHTYTNKILSTLPNNLWGALLSSKIDIFLKIQEKSDVIENIADINACSTAAEAEEFENHLSEHVYEDSFKYINNGTINRYIQLWGKKELRKNKMVKPYLSTRYMSNRRKEMFSLPKLIFVKLSKCPQVYYDENGEFASANTNMVYNIIGYNYKFLLGYLNSKLFDFIYHTMYGGLSMLGTVQIQAPQIKKSLIPQRDICKNEQNKIVDLVDSILTIKKQDVYADTSVLESEIDRIVYQLYGLNYDEVLIIDPTPPFTREEYERKA